ncbi:MAG TPA: RsmE family RNA methyltransferase [Candidatus Magasanikbacteria bacterium]|nr:RsmE family RNA methyltransferase [Candidatus Magasanikbacteria bacterium]
MKIHRFLITEKITEGEMVVQNKELIHQLQNVLKLKTGELIIIFNNQGEFQGIIKDLTKKSLKLSAVAKNQRVYKLKNQAILYCAILKKENFEMIVQKATEVGVKKIVPLVTGHTVKLNLNLSRLRKIAQEAAEQSGRLDVPEISPILSLKESLDYIQEGELAWCLDTTSQIEVIAPVEDKMIHLFIGPEGGWTDEERVLFTKHHFSFLSLGPLVLRGETAAIIASYLACNG